MDPRIKNPIGSFGKGRDEGIVRFEGNARISDSTNEVTGALLVYDVEAQQVAFEGDSETGERVKIVVQPPEDAAEAAAEEAMEEAVEAIDREDLGRDDIDREDLEP